MIIGIDEIRSVKLARLGSRPQRARLQAGDVALGKRETT